MPAGSTVVMFTDGLVERRDGGIDAGRLLLTAALSRHGAHPVGTLLDRVLAELVGEGGGHADDIAILAARMPPRTAHGRRWRDGSTGEPSAAPGPP